MNEMTLKEFIKNKRIPLVPKLSVIVYLLLLIPVLFLICVIKKYY